MRPRNPPDVDDATSSSPFDSSALHGRLVHGTCGWASKSQNLSFYAPNELSSGERRLPSYAERFGCVEVDSTTYAIPTRDVVQRWVDATPDGFVFLVKAFGGLCASTVDARSLPREVREMLAPTPSGRVAYSSMPTRAKDALWARWNDAIAPIVEAGKLGCVVFQFHLSQGVGDALRAHALECQSRLNGARTAVEFRNRDWITGDVGTQTVRWCREHDLLLVAADELEHETFQRDRQQTGLPVGAVRRKMPTRLERTVDWGCLIRVHRRHGTTERVLDEEEISFWSERVRALHPKPTRGPIWVTWGTEWRDAPLTNALALDDAVGEFAYDWYGTRRSRPSKSKPSAKSIAALFAAAPQPKAKSPTSTPPARKSEARKHLNPLAALWSRANPIEDARRTD